MQEIERKFLVKDNSFKTNALKATAIAQGYLSTHPERTVRVRIKGKKGFLTIKGKGNLTGTTRFEWEKEIPVEEAKMLLQLCEKGVIEKTRYEIPVGNHTFEVDEFYGENAGLLLAEIELAHEDEIFEKPNWLGAEVTGNVQYYNAYLCQNPYITWEI
ncbi:CYTH domain-containing protein [Flavobacterium sp. NST-5]|uniref:CYTH domain-containing protein n=1 Tax=Flavobacterium ichthyis TaxID=2698827 RepID=A0ABW9Z7U8_9FLAO|nr:CYTH domain-containing protein [Flavobacterium ichthyis]NBL64709.1 CYTH domain-containing protein [Flavobacterium ichthyis]